MASRLFLSLFIFIANQLIAQNDFRAGFIITPTKDTVRGEINYHENFLNYGSCEFKKSLAGYEVTTYSPNQLTSYGFNNDRFFQSKQVELPDNTTRLVFLEVLVEGRITLYKLKEKGYFELFFLEKDGNLYRINNGLPRKPDEPRKQLGILNYAMYDCPSMHSKMAEVDPDEQSLVKITEQYNACMKEEGASYKTSKKWIRFSPHVSVGAVFSMFKVNANGSDLSEGKYDPSFSAVFGVGVDVSLPRIHERWAFHIEAIVMPSEYTLTKTTYTVISVSKYDFNVKANQLKIPVGIKYIFPNKKFKFFVNGGASFTSNRKENSTVTRTTTYSGIDFDPVTSEGNGILDHLFGSWIGIGGYIPVHKKLDLYMETRYEVTDGLFYMEGYMNSRLNNVSAVVGVRFN